ncbi:hypothetical protein D1P53_003431 [Cryptococcus gattii VGV]|nr:hypothetical protein D1P53_003431 [Cryptococcus gattii VGV]
MSSSCLSHPASRVVVVEHLLSPTSISRTHHQLHLAGERSTATTPYDSSGQDVGNIQSRPLETDPMLLLPATTHIPPRTSSLLVSSTDPITTMGSLDQGVAEGYQADQTIETAASPPPPSTKNPSSPALPFSKRLFHAFVHKPTLSRTWEKKSFMDDEKKSAPAAMGGGPNLERDDHDLDSDGCLASPSAKSKSKSRCRSRPMSLYAFPAEIAAFKPLPLMLDDERNVQGHTQMAQMGMLAITPT